jgi:hypothetical protein
MSLSAGLGKNFDLLNENDYANMASVSNSDMVVCAATHILVVAIWQPDSTLHRPWAL